MYHYCALVILVKIKHKIYSFLTKIQIFYSSDKPSAPSGPLEVSEADANSVTIHWKAPESDGGIPIKRYTIERRETKRVAWIKADTVKSSVTTLTVDKLMEGCDYVFRVMAENDEGQSVPLELLVPVTCKRVASKYASHAYGSHTF